MFYTQTNTFTVFIHWDKWIGKDNPAGASLLMSYFVDVLEALPLDKGVLVGPITNEPVLYFTFGTKLDRELFIKEVDTTWNQGGWLRHD